MKALKYIFFLFLIAIIGFAMYVAVQPNSYSFSITKSLKAPASLVYDKVASVTDENYFLLNETLDAEITIESLRNSNQEKNTSIKQDVTFIKNFNALSTLDWSFNKVATGTDLNLQVEGKHDFNSKLKAIFKGSVETRLKPLFEKSLTKLDSTLQIEMNQYTIETQGITEHSGGFYLYKASAAKLTNFENKRHELFGEIGSYAIANNISMAGKPFVIFHTIDEQNDTVMFTCAIPTNSKIESNDAEILTGQLDTFTTVKTVLKGDHKNLNEAWRKMSQYISDNNLEVIENGVRLEVYVTDKNETENPAELVTELFIEVKPAVLSDD